MTNPTPRTAAQSDGAMREIGCPHDSWGAVFPCPTCGTPRSLVPATRQRVATPDAGLRAALETATVEKLGRRMYRTASGIPMEMPAKIERIVRHALATPPAEEK